MLKVSCLRALAFEVSCFFNFIIPESNPKRFDGNHVMHILLHWPFSNWDPIMMARGQST